MSLFNNQVISGFGNILKPAACPATDKPDKQRCFEMICLLLSLVGNYEGIFIKPDDHDLLHIQLHPLPGGDGGPSEHLRQFFKPWARSEIEKYPIHFDDSMLAKALEYRKYVMAHGPKSEYVRQGFTLFERLGCISSILVSEFMEYTRNNMPDGRPTIRSMTQWRYQR
ncbi:uncharacterized protein LDX57_011791 [Aspergillus melleus]|uniref:uncharacterized protein n=1 Tax=Aspergillus melleus TaxID=138277 RepID=UPI001E8CEA90|nr:uncharacterized protein LDX57_011791 [Aspergillus melleus]KAH8434153.1 hypothetical protein LDX57_011791 [Aspergillus melleus]